MKTENCVAKVSKRTTSVLRFFLGNCSLLIKEKFLLKITVRKKKIIEKASIWGRLFCPSV